eukprot:363698-Chlamydomonas_euryale.AAC.3
MRLAAPPPARLRGAHVPTAAPLPSPAALRGSCHGVSLTSSSACSLLPPSPLLSSRPARQLSARAAASSGSAAATDLGASRRRGDVYIVSEEEREAFHRDGCGALHACMHARAGMHAWMHACMRAAQACMLSRHACMQSAHVESLHARTWAAGTG